MIGALVVAVAAVSLTAIVFQGRDDDSGPSAALGALRSGVAATTTSTTSTTTSTTTTSTSTTASPLAPTAAPGPVETAPVQTARPSPPPVCDGGASAVIDAMNADRAAAGLGALCSSAALAGYAQSWARWMAQHQTLTHQDLGNVLAGTSFSTVAENILDGPGSMSTGQMEAAWMGSPPHRQNVLDGAATAAGVGIASSADGRVWVAVDFGG